VLLIQAMDGHQNGKMPGWRWVAVAAGLLFYILLNGGFHQFVWGLFFLGFFGLFDWKYLPLMLKTLVAACLLGMVRLLPPALQLGSFDTEYLGGYPSLIELFDGLVRLVDPYKSFDVRSYFTALGWWEFDLYIGVSGALFLLGFGLWHWLRHIRSTDSFAPLFAPALAVLLLAIGRVYRPFMLLPIPLINGERVSARLAILPFLVLAVMAAVQMQRWLDGRKLRVELRAGMAALAVLLVHDVWQHTRAWRVNNALFAFGQVDLDLAIKVVANHPDAVYTNLLMIGAAITLVTAVGLIVLAWRKPYGAAV